MLPGRGLRAQLPPPHADLLHKPRVPKGDRPQSQILCSAMAPTTCAGNHSTVLLNPDCCPVMRRACAVDGGLDAHGG